MCSYLSGGDGHLNLAARSRHDLVELVADTLEETEAVVLGESVEEVLDGGFLAARLLNELGDDGGLVLGGESRGRQDGSELSILLEDVAEVGEGLGSGLEGRRLGSGSVLEIDAVSISSQAADPHDAIGRRRAVNWPMAI